MGRGNARDRGLLHIDSHHTFLLAGPRSLPIRIKYLTGIINALPSIAFAILSPMWGSLADNYGRKPMLLRAMFGGAAVLVLQGFVSDPWQLLVLRTVQGCITGTIAAATVLVASIAPPEETGYALGLLQMAVFLGASLGPMFGGVISDAFSHRVTFFATSFLLLAAGIIIAKLAEGRFRSAAESQVHMEEPDPGLQSPARSKALWALMAVVAADQIAGSIVAPFLPLFIQSITRSSGMVSSTTGVILGVGALASAVAAASLGKLSYRIGYRRTLVVCMVTAAVFTIPQAFVHSPLELLILQDRQLLLHRRGHAVGQRADRAPDRAGEAGERIRTHELHLFGIERHRAGARSIAGRHSRLWLDIHRDGPDPRRVGARHRPPDSTLARAGVPARAQAYYRDRIREEGRR